MHLILSTLQTLRKPPLPSPTTSLPLSSVDESRTFGHRCPLCLDALGTRGVRVGLIVFGCERFAGDHSNTLWTSCLLDLPAGRAQGNRRMCCLQVFPMPSHIGFHMSFLCSDVHFRFSLSPALNCYNIINATRVTNKDNHRQCWSIPTSPESAMIVPFPIHLSLVLMTFLFAPCFPQETGGASHCDTLQKFFLCHINFVLNIYSQRF